MQAFSRSSMLTKGGRWIKNWKMKSEQKIPRYPFLPLLNKFTCYTSLLFWVKSELSNVFFNKISFFWWNTYIPLRSIYWGNLKISANVNNFFELWTHCSTNSTQNKGLASKNILKTGLMSDNANGHAWIRDNVYSILSVWALSMAYKKYRSIFFTPSWHSF